MNNEHLHSMETLRKKKETSARTGGAEVATDSEEMNEFSILPRASRLGPFVT
jgi:hypothetical protein